jgi:SAM-dependent methyltransferase
VLPDEYAHMYHVEDSHWWYQNLHYLVLGLLRRELGEGVNRPSILDAGCGTGSMAAQLSSLGEVTAMDFSPHALRFCRARNLPRLAAASVNTLPFADAAFNAAVSLDVLCHASVDDRQAMRELSRVLRPGGLLVLNLPAYQWLHGRHDLAVQTARRYTRGEVVSLLRGAALEPVWISPWNTLLFPAAAAVRIAGRWGMRGREARSDVGPVSPLLNQALKRVLTAERRLMRRKSLPFGLSILAVGRRAGSV